MDNIERLRLRLDEAITYADFKLARKLAKEGLRVAHNKELLGEIMYFRAQMEIIAENYEAAMKYLDLAIKYNPMDGAAYNDRALCMVELGKFKEAFNYFDKGIEVEPDYATVYHNKGWLLNKVGLHEEAIQFFEKALKLEPNRAVTYENMANAFVCLGRVEEALKAYKKALILVKSSYHEIKRQIETQIKKLEKLSSR